MFGSRENENETKKKNSGKVEGKEKWKIKNKKN